MRLFLYLTPLIPLSMIGISSLHEGEELCKRGFASLRLSLSIFLFKLPVINAVNSWY